MGEIFPASPNSRPLSHNNLLDYSDQQNGQKRKKDNSKRLDKELDDSQISGHSPSLYRSQSLGDKVHATVGCTVVLLLGPLLSMPNICYTPHTLPRSSFFIHCKAATGIRHAKPR